ncbi:spore germination protein [Paenibacillus sp. NFR01]|uniref:spore germination protein n=1 Tax=Paenibacillus sp. NFR01 TaxID=1566279 RepID=UPI0008CD7914|nr:spore germination protein [Paenibacillus sp. NFR01]SES95552.1 GerA spore germination protein [Paenibacillus sp. NFR01]
MPVKTDELWAKMNGSFDFIRREIRVGPDTATLFYIETICDSSYISQYIIEPLASVRQGFKDKAEVAQAIYASKIGEVQDLAAALEHLLTGDPVLVFEALEHSIFFDAKKIETRAVEKSQFEASLVGSNESFNELLVNNVSLLRKRMATEKLQFESLTLGSQSKTQAVLVYLDGTAPSDLVRTVRQKLSEMENTFVLDIHYVTEVLSPDKSLFDTIGYSDKPDAVAAKLFEGRIAVLVNGSPFALTAPSFFLESLQAPDDYSGNRLFASMLRLVRLISALISLLLPGFYVAVTTHHFSLIPSAFVFKLAVSRSGVPFPTVVEVILMFLFFELSREAGRRLPHQIGQALSIVGALILGDAAVGAGLASQATVVVTGIYAITSFINPRLTSAVSVWAIFSIIMSACFGLHGFYMGFILLVAHLAALRSCDYPYLFPFGTERSFRKATGDVLLRGPLKKISKPFVYKGNKP